MRKNKYLTPWTNSMLIFCRKAIIGQHRCQTVFIVGDKVCAHFGRDVGPLLPADSLQVIQVPRLSPGNSNFKLPPKIFNRIQVWRLARPLQNLDVLLLQPLFCCFGGVLRVVVVLKHPSLTHLQLSHWGKEVLVQNSTVHGPVHPPLNAMELSRPLGWKAPPKHDVATTMLDGGDGVLWVVLCVLCPPNTASWVEPKKFYFGLIWPHHLLPGLFWVVQVVNGELNAGLYMFLLEQGDLACAAGFQSMTA